MSDQATATNGKPDADAAEGAWEVDKRGRRYVKHPDGGRVVFRRGEETIAEALTRDATAPPSGDKRPRAKSKKPKLPPPPSHIDLKQLEQALVEALSTPAMGAAMIGDEWAANHFTTQAPLLARNLVLASEHNPWLRRKLEAAATGQDTAMAALAMLGLAGAAFAYAVPPIVWWLNLPVPDRARVMFNIPPAREKPTSDAPGPESTPAAEAEPVAA